MPGWQPRSTGRWSGALRPQHPRARLLAAAGAPSGTHPPHVLASPPGTAAPVGAINYTPSTNQIHPPGQMAPVDELNYSLLPAGGGMGGGQEQSMPSADFLADWAAPTANLPPVPGASLYPPRDLGATESAIITTRPYQFDPRVWEGKSPDMGAGAAAPSSPVIPGQERLTGRYAPPASMATGQASPGAPPTRPAPFGTGPGPRSAPSGAQTPSFSNRASMQGNARGWGMGTGQSDGSTSDMTPEELQQQLDQLDTSSLGTTDTGGNPASEDTSGTAGASTDQGVVASDPHDNIAVQTAQTISDPSATPPSGWHSEGNPNDPPGKPYALWWVSDDGNKRIFVGTFQYSVPGVPPRFVRATATQTQQMSTGVDLKPATTAKTPGRVTLRGADGKNHVYATDPSTGKLQVGADGKPVVLGDAPTQPKDSTTTPPKNTTTSETIIGSDGQPHRVQITRDPSGKIISRDDLGTTIGGSSSSSTAVETQRAQAQLATDKPYTTFPAADGSTWLVDLETGDAKPLTPADPSKNTYTVGNQLIYVDPDTQEARVIATAPHNWSVTTSGGKTLAYDPEHPQNHIDMAIDPSFAPQAAATLEETKANTAKLLADLQNGKITTEDARMKLALAAHDLEHPGPQFIGTSDVYIPPGGSLNIDYSGTASGKFGADMGVQHVSGGPLDPQAQAIAKQVQDFLGQLDSGTKRTADQGNAATTPTTTAQTQAAPSGPQVTPGQPIQLAPSAITSDPSSLSAMESLPLSTTARTPLDIGAMPGSVGGRQSTQLPTTFTQSGIPEGTSRTSPRVGSTLDVGLTPTAGELGVSGSSSSDDRQYTFDDSGGLDLGTGQDTFMGRGLTPETGRGSTGIGWQPKVPGWQAGAGHTSAGGRGGGGMAGGGGAGQDEQGGIGQWLGDRASDIGQTLSDIGTAWNAPRPPQDPNQMVTTIDGKQHPIGETLMTVHGRIWTGSRSTPTPDAAQGAGQDGAHMRDPLDHFAMSRRQGAGAGQAGPMPPGAPPPGAAAPQPAQASPPLPGAPQAGWTPPVPPQAVAGIGHRFGQDMNVGEPQHSGVDLQAPEGTSTVSPVDGMVERIEHNPAGLGLTLIIRSKDGSEHRLGHLSRTDAYPGMIVAQGQDLQSKVGSSGNTTGAHLHWGVRDGQGQPQDPTAALGPMANLPPVPGTQQMGPPGGTPGPGGPPPSGGPPAAPPAQGSGQEEDSSMPGWSVPTLWKWGGRTQSGVLPSARGGGATFGEAGDPLASGLAESRPLLPDDITRPGAGQDQGTDPSQMPGGANTSSPDYQAGYQAGIQASKSPGTPPVFVPAMQQPIPGANDGGGGGGDGGRDMGAGQSASHLSDPLYHFAMRQRAMRGVGAGQGAPHDMPHYILSLWGTEPGAPPGGEMVTGFSGGQEGGYFTGPEDNPTFGNLKDFPRMRAWNITPGATGSGQESSADFGQPMDLKPRAWEPRRGGAFKRSNLLDYGQEMYRPFGSPQDLENMQERGVLGSGQDSADARWDLYEAKDTQGFWGPPGQPQVGAGGEGGMGAGAIGDVVSTNQYGDQVYSTPNGNKTGTQITQELQAAGWQGQGNPVSVYNQTAAAGQSTNAPSPTSSDSSSGSLKITPSQQATINYNNAALAAQTAQAQAQLQASIQAENDRHQEAEQTLQQQLQFHQDDVALQQAVNAETTRHNQALEQLQAQQTQMQQTLEQMREANAVQLQQMQEGNQIYLQQGQQAFADWQAQQTNRMQILSSALNNPWLQQLTGMTPAPGVNEGVTGGQNLANLIQQIEQPWNTQAWGAQNAPSSAGLGTTTAGGAPATAGGMPQVFGGSPGAPQINTPSWSQWQGWDPFQMAAYRTNIEALGPGVWNQVQSGLQGAFAAQGGSPDVTQMQAAAATPEQQIGEQMTANVFGQTTPQWQANQQKRWSQAQAPQVKEGLAGIAT